MSNNQTDMALKMIENAQKELGYDFHIADFRRLIEAQDKSSESINKEMQAIIGNMAVNV